MTADTTVLVAGAAGFIGSNLCKQLLDEGKRVIGVDDFSSGLTDNMAELADKDRFVWEQADISDMGYMHSDVDRIYHLASMASPSHFQERPMHIALTNAIGTKNLLMHSDRLGARMVYASTSEVYGDPEIHPQPEAYNGNVNFRGPRACYDVSKRYGEMMTTLYWRQRNVDVRTARIFNTYGVGMRIDDGRVIPTFIRQALTGEDITVYGNGQQTRSFCYVTDTITGLRKLMDGVGLQGEVFNIGRPKEITIISLAEMIADLCDSDSDIVFERLPQDDPTRRKPDIQKAKDELLWEPEVDLAEGLNKTIGYFRLEMQEL